MSLMKKLATIMKKDLQKKSAKETPLIALDGEHVVDIFKKFDLIREELEQKETLTVEEAKQLENLTEDMLEELKRAFSEHGKQHGTLTEYTDEELEEMKKNK